MPLTLTAQQIQPPDTFLLEKAINDFSRQLSDTVFTTSAGDMVSPEQGIHYALKLLHDVDMHEGCIYVIGNGGSAAVASHVVNDFCNTAALRAITIHDPALLTCYANDYGYENAYAKLLDRLAKPHDLLIAISSSGASKNICQSVEVMLDRGLAVMTLSGFAADNPLRSQGHLNVWIDSYRYTMVEIGHLFLLHHLCDRHAAQ